MTNIYTFPGCGCEFEILDDSTSPPRLKFETDIEKIPLDCPRTWELLSKYSTCGCFQLESNLGQSYCHKLQPENIEQLAALTAIIRPGCLEVEINGKNITSHYIDRKNKIDEVNYFHPALENVLANTYGLQIYQEDSMNIAKAVAGFDLKQAHLLMKAVGKKKTDIMAKVKVEFLDGCKKTGIVTDEQAEEIFGWIEKSQRYSFNKCCDLELTKVDLIDNGGKIYTIPISKVQVGDIISSPFGNTKVIDIHYNGDRPIFAWSTGNGQILCATLEHKVLCEDDILRPLYHAYHCNIRVKTDDDINLANILCVDNLGSRPTIDLEVDNEKHIFYANGIAVSNSHSVSYALNSYLSAYAKCHFRRAFFTSYLNYVDGKQKPSEERRQLCLDAKKFHIETFPPDVRNITPYADSRSDGIYLGFLDIKGIGDSVLKKFYLHLHSVLTTYKHLGINSIGEMSWTNWLIDIIPYISSTVTTNMIECGAMSYLKLPRTKMLFESTAYNKLTPKEKNWVRSNPDRHNWNDLKDILSAILDAPTGKIGACAHEKRQKVISDLLESLKNPPYPLEDNIEWMAGRERDLLGLELTCMPSDGKFAAYKANCTCDDFTRGKHPKTTVLAVSLGDVREITIKRGKNAGGKMAFIPLADITGSADGVAFTETWKTYRHLLFENNNVLVVGKRGDKKSLIIEKVKQL